MATVYENLIPRAMAREILAASERQSAVLSLGRRIVMPSGLVSVPIVSFLPVAGFVNPRYGGRKPATKVEWTAQNVQAEECACVLALPNAHVMSERARYWAFCSGFAFTVQALFFAPRVAPFLYFQF